MYSKTERRNRITLYLAVAHFASDHHSGQWSRGYRLWCVANKRLNSLGIARPLDKRITPKAMDLYSRLVLYGYGHKM